MAVSQAETNTNSNTFYHLTSGLIGICRSFFEDSSLFLTFHRVHRSFEVSQKQLTYHNTTLLWTKIELNGKPIQPKTVIGSKKPLNFKKLIRHSKEPCSGIIRNGTLSMETMNTRNLLKSKVPLAAIAQMFTIQTGRARLLRLTIHHTTGKIQ